MASLTIRLDAKLERDIARLAKAQKRTKSEVVRDMLRRYTTLEMFELARNELRPLAEKAGWLTDEDVFREVS
jgi:predicted transcriptional regulator